MFVNFDGKKQMPLIILGIIVAIALFAYWYIGNQDGDEPEDLRGVRERYSHAFGDKAKDAGEELKKEIRRRAGIYDADFDVEDDGYGNSGDDNTIPFPSDVEEEKRKRNIH